LAAGRSREMYDMISVQGLERKLSTNRKALVDTAVSTTQTSVLLHSLSGDHVLVPLRKKPAHAGQDVLLVRSTVC
jgi:hypothetical protein